MYTEGNHTYLMEFLGVMTCNRRYQMLANSSRYLSAWVRARVLGSPGKGCPDDHLEVEAAVYFTSKTF